MSFLAIGAAVGTAIQPWLGEWVTVTIATAIVQGMKTQLNPDEMKQVLKRATNVAEEKQPETNGLFFRCQRDGRNGVTQFLGKFFQTGEVLRELQKPLQDDGKPMVEVLVKAFEPVQQRDSKTLDGGLC
jgi:hypothetical protein